MTDYLVVTGEKCPQCADESIVRGTNELGESCWVAEGWATEDTPGIAPPGVEIFHCPFCGLDLQQAMGEIVPATEALAVAGPVKVGMKLAPFIIHLLPDEWAFTEFRRQVDLHFDKQPVLRLVVEQGNPPNLSDVYITFRKGVPKELREPATRKKR